MTIGFPSWDDLGFGICPASSLPCLIRENQWWTKSRCGDERGIDQGLWHLPFWGWYSIMLSYPFSTIFTLQGWFKWNKTDTMFLSFVYPIIVITSVVSVHFPLTNLMNSIEMIIPPQQTVLMWGRVLRSSYGTRQNWMRALRGCSKGPSLTSGGASQLDKSVLI